MSDITPDLVRHLASLSRIDLHDEEVTSLTSELGQIVESIAKVQEVATPEVAATSHPIPLQNVSRPDEVGPTLTQEEALRNAPDAEDGRFRVPAILGGEQ